MPNNGFNPNQPRDKNGMWTDGSPSIANVDKASYNTYFGKQLAKEMGAPFVGEDVNLHPGLGGRRGMVRHVSADGKWLVVRTLQGNTNIETKNIVRDAKATIDKIKSKAPKATQRSVKTILQGIRDREYVESRVKNSGLNAAGQKIALDFLTPTKPIKAKISRQNAQEDKAVRTGSSTAKLLAIQSKVSSMDAVIAPKNSLKIQTPKLTKSQAAKLVAPRSTYAKTAEVANFVKGTGGIYGKQVKGDKRYGLAKQVKVSKVNISETQRQQAKGLYDPSGRAIAKRNVQAQKTLAQKAGYTPAGKDVQKFATMIAKNFGATIVKPASKPKRK